MDYTYRKYKVEFMQVFRNACIEIFGKNLEQLIDSGVSISEFELKVQKTANEDLCKKYNLTESHFKLRPIIASIVAKRYGSVEAWCSTEAFIKHRTAKTEATCLKKFGVRNVGLTEKHKQDMRIVNGTTKNPFAKTDFKIREYIKGKRCKPGDEPAYTNYAKSVWKETNKHKKELNDQFTGYCYYTGMPIIKFKVGENNPNDQKIATIDHKESIMSGFLRHATPEEIGGLDNLCWTSRYFNSLKGPKNELELRLNGTIERFKECMHLIFEEKNENN